MYHFGDIILPKKLIFPKTLFWGIFCSKKDNFSKSVIYGDTFCPKKGNSSKVPLLGVFGENCFAKKALLWKISIVLMWYVPAGAFFFSQKRHFSEKQALCLCGICPQGLFFPQKRHFSEKPALCLCGICPQGLFFSSKNDF